MSYVFANKAVDIESFQMNIFKTGIFSEIVSNSLGYIVLLIEMISIILLLLNKGKGLNFLIIILLSFTLYISILYHLNRYEVCGCGGILNGLSYKTHMLINVILIVVSLLSRGLMNTCTKNEKYKVKTPIDN